MMKYFIGYLIQGEAGNWHVSVARDISEKFNTWKIYEKLPPHITISYLAEVEDIEPFRKILRDWTQNKKVFGNFTISDYDRFGDKVVFAKVDSDQPVQSSIEELKKIIEKVPSVPKDDFPIWEPHATLANRLTPEEINKIWEYILTLPKPDFVMPFDNVTIFRFDGDMKWVVDETFRFDL